MEPWHWAIVLKPFALLALFTVVALIAYPLRKLPDCKLKRFLFFSWRV